MLANKCPLKNTIKSDRLTDGLHRPIPRSIDRSMESNWNKVVKTTKKQSALGSIIPLAQAASMLQCPSATAKRIPTPNEHHRPKRCKCASLSAIGGPENLDFSPPSHLDRIDVLPERPPHPWTPIWVWDSGRVVRRRIMTNARVFECRGKASLYLYMLHASHVH